MRDICRVSLSLLSSRPNIFSSLKSCLMGHGLQVSCLINMELVTQLKPSFVSYTNYYYLPDSMLTQLTFILT